jgi:uncharacterized protein (DUF1501 family)
MLTRRQFLNRSLQGTSLLAVGTVVPQFLANTAWAAQPGKDTVLVVIELSGGNDGLNTVIPYADDLYHKARKTLRHTKEQVVRVDDHIGLNSGMASFRQLLDKGQLAIVQGVGYPNPDRSHFESMDIWQSADPKRQMNTGWLGRSANDLQDKKGNVPMMQIGPKQLPLALQGAPGAVVSINHEMPYRLDLGGGSAAKQKARRQLMEDLAKSPPSGSPPSSLGDGSGGGLLQFVQRRQLQTYATLDRLNEVLQELQTNQGPSPIAFGPDGRFLSFGSLSQRLNLIARLIQKGFGTRVFYVSLDGFDTHSNQAEAHRRLLQELADAVTGFFQQLQNGGHDKRVLAMTFSEFGRRVQENGSRGTDHGAASCLFVAGPAVKGGPVGKHPSLSDLDAGDLKHHTDFRSLYATLLDQWLNVDSKVVLGGQFSHVDLVKAKV